MKQLRQKFTPIRKSLEKGDQYLLMYRSKPLAVLRPYSPSTDAQHLPAGEEKPALPAANTLHSLPNPQTISFGSKITADTKPNPTSTETSTSPLNRLGMRKAFV